MEIKICTNCNKEFTPTKNDKRIKYCCEECRVKYRNKNSYNKKYYKENKDRFEEYRKREEVIDRKNEQRRVKYATDKEYRENIKNKVKVYHKKNPKVRLSQRLKPYGITISEYETMLKNQNGKCAICGRKDSGDTQSKRLYVDHDHITGKVRGLLCSQCNMGLGKFFDNTDYLQNAIKYLEENKNG